MALPVRGSQHCPSPWGACDDIQHCLAHDSRRLTIVSRSLSCCTTGRAWRCCRSLTRHGYWRRWRPKRPPSPMRSATATPRCFFGFPLCRPVCARSFWWKMGLFCKFDPNAAETSAFALCQKACRARVCSWSESASRLQDADAAWTCSACSTCCAQRCCRLLRGRSVSEIWHHTPLTCCDAPAPSQRSELLFMASWHPLAPDVLTMAEEHASLATEERAAINAPVDPAVSCDSFVCG